MSKEAPVQEATIRAMTGELSHRGPDAQGFHIDALGRVALGHTRLSIIDLSQAANQPMLSSDGRLAIVFNGEIYNYRELRKQLSSFTFRTQSDTETILAAFLKWGPPMVEKLEGMFAMAIYDAMERKLYLFRDRIGKKPLFYYMDSNQFAFASEIKSLLRHPATNANKRVDQQAIQRFLHLGFVPSPATIYTTVRKLPAGCAAVVDQELSLKIEPYWEVDHHLSNERISDESSAVNLMRQELTTAVQRRLVSDVPVGCFLSGGNDSSLVTAIAQRNSRSRLRTFTIGFEQQRFDERPFAREVASILGTDHEEFLLSEKSAFESIDDYVRHFDEPFADTSAIPTMLISKLARKQVKVALTGDGGDELFLGYGSYDWAKRLSNPLFRLAKAPMRIAFSMSGNDRLQRIAHLLEPVAADATRSHIFSQEQYLFSQDELRDGMMLPQQPLTYRDPLFESMSPEERQAVFDLKFYLPDDLLVKVDRASMRYGLECRCPLLDHNVVALAMKLDLKHKMSAGIRKRILKQLLEEYLPGSLVLRRKHGFSIPLAEWLRGELKYLIDRHLSPDAVEAAGVCKTEFVKRTVQSFLSGSNYMYNRVWALIVLHKWMSEHLN